MRLFELHPSEDRPRLAFHPRVTVVQGLEPHVVDELKGLLRTLASGEAAAWSGTVEVHGVLIPLEGLPRLVGPAMGEPVIARIEEVLPPVPGPPDEGADDPRVESHAQAVAARRALEERVAVLADKLAAFELTREGLQEQLTAALSRVDRADAAELDAADRDLNDEARARELDPFVTLPDPEARLEHLREVVAECDRILPLLPAGDRGAVAAANATLRAAMSSGPVVSPEADALAEVWLSLHRRLEGIQSRLAIAHGDTEAVEARLEAARSAVEQTHEASTPREVTAEEDDKLEELHTEMMRLKSRATSGVWRGGAKKQLDAVHAELQDLLDDLGYPTFMAYRMGNGLSIVDPAERERFELAMAELEAVESEWSALMSALEGEHELNDVLVAIEQISERAADLLGSSVDELQEKSTDTLAQELREVRVDADSLAVEMDDAADHLQMVLDDAGCSGHRDVSDTEAVLALGDSWIEVLRAADDAALRVLRDRERSEAEIAVIEEISPSAGADLLADRRDRVTRAEAEVAELRRGLTTLATSRRELHDLAASVLATAENHDAKVELLDAARVMEELTESRLPSNIRLATTRRGITALVPRGIGGPVPMMVELGETDDFALEQLIAVPDDVQVIAIGGDERVVEWVEALGPTHASVIDVRARV